MDRITLTQDAPLRENWYPKGTGFVVVETPDPKAEPVQIDRRTAQAWLTNDWAKVDDGEAEPKGKADAG